MDEIIEKIVSARYKSKTNTNWVEITLENDEKKSVSVDDGVRRKYTRSFKKFIGDGGEIKPFETEEEKAERLKKEVRREGKYKRDELLKKGTISADGRMWFNFDSADMFMNAVGTLDPDETIKWYDKDRQVVELTYDEAKAYAKEIRLVMQSLYGLEG